jgi:hypothetical protein
VIGCEGVEAFGVDIGFYLLSPMASGVNGLIVINFGDEVVVFLGSFPDKCLLCLSEKHEVPVDFLVSL